MARPTGALNKYHGDWYDAFLLVLRKTANVTKSAKAVGLSKMACYQARERDLEFAEKWQDALDEGLDALEESLMKRGRTGKSDTAAIFLLKSHRREIYGDHTNVNMNMSGRVIHTHRVDLSQLTDEELDTLELIVGKAGIPLLPEGAVEQPALPSGYSD